MASPTDSATDSEGQDIDDSEEAQFAALEDGSDGAVVGDEEPDILENDEIALDVLLSDEAMVTGVIEEVDSLDNRLEPLTAWEATVGRIAIAKVSPEFNLKIYRSSTASFP